MHIWFLDSLRNKVGTVKNVKTFMLIYKYVTKGISVSFNRAPAQVNKINQALIKQAVLVNIIS